MNPLKVSNFDQTSHGMCHRNKFHKRINQYTVSKVLGVGATSKVLLAQNKESK